MNLNPLAAEEQFLNPLDRVNGFDIRPGLYEINGATSFGSCVNFTIHSQNAVSCELLLFHRGEKESLTGRFLFRKITGSGGYIR